MQAYFDEQREELADRRASRLSKRMKALWYFSRITRIFLRHGLAIRCNRIEGPESRGA